MELAKLLLGWIQPLTVIIFVIASICQFLVGNKHLSAINFCYGLANFIVFYGKGFLK